MQNKTSQLSKYSQSQQQSRQSSYQGYDPNPGEDDYHLRVGLTEVEMFLSKEKLRQLKPVSGTSLYKHIMREEEVKPIVEEGVIYIDSDPEMFRFVVDYLNSDFQWDVI